MDIAAIAASSGPSSMLIATIIWGTIGLIISLLIYLIPSIVALKIQHHRKIPILLINIFFGWTFTGWIVALVWVASNNKNSSTNKSE